MAKANSKRNARTVAVGYVRRSTRKQEQSIDDQKREIERLVKERGYEFTGWYEDDGISGDATIHRAGFQAMIRDADSGRFSVILCWDQDRFGRFDSVEAGYWIHPLRRAGVRLETVADGPINWDDFAGRIVNAVKQEGKHQFLLDLSRNTARGQISIAQRGYLTGQAAPYGYDRMYVDEAGNEMRRVKEGEKIAKPRSWHATLVPSDEPQKIETVKWLFKTYAETPIGMRTLAEELNDRGVPSPRGGDWCQGTVREILKNEAYIGRFVWLRRRIGKYNWIKNGDILQRDKGEVVNDKGRVVNNDPEDWIVRDDAWVALIDRKLFDRVQKQREKKRGNTSGAKHANKAIYLLSGLVRCGHCGGKMHGENKSRKKKGKKGKKGECYYYPRYTCSTKKKNNQCNTNGIHAEQLARVVIRQIRNAIMQGNTQGQLTERIRYWIEKRKQATPAEADALREQLAELDAAIQRGQKRLLVVPDDVFKLLSGQLGEAQRNRERVARELATLDAAPGVEAADEAETIAARLWHFAESLDSEDYQRVTQLLQDAIVNVRLFFEHEVKKNRTYSHFSKGIVELRPHVRAGFELSPLDSRGDRI